MSKRTSRERARSSGESTHHTTVDPARSILMRRVRRTGTAPEQRVTQYLSSHGVSYRKNVKRLPGSPDISNVTEGFAIFVHGCFWHRHEGCPRATLPTANREFWEAK